MFALRPRFLAVLALAMLGLLASIVVPPIVRSIQAQNAQANEAAANRAFAHLRVPADFRPYPTANKVLCPSGLLCYYVARPDTTISKLTLIGILRSVGAKYDAGPSHCTTIDNARPPGPRILTNCTEYARIDGLYVYALDTRYLLCEKRCAWTADSQVWVSPPFTPSDD